MFRSRRFLLLLVLFSIMCVVFVQISMDGKNVNTTLQYNSSPNSRGSESRGNEFISSVAKSSLRTQVSSIRAAVKTITTSKPSQNHHYSKPAVKILKTTENCSELIRKADNPAAKIQIRRQPLAKKVLPQIVKPELVNRQERIQEILNQGYVIRKQAAVDPTKLLNMIPIAESDKVTRIFILTYFRSGSSFFGDILQQNWKTFYEFEPLHSMTYDKRIDDDKTRDAFSLFNSMFRCNLTTQKQYMQWVRQSPNQFLFAHNLFLWVTCHRNPKTCFNPTFVDAVCVRAPVHVMKVTRLHMRQLKQYLLENPDLNIKVVHLTRDPRGIVSSRWSLDWCNGTNCSDPGVLCREMDEDIKIFNELKEEQPLHFIQVRYEDLSMNPENETQKLLHFLNLPYSPSVRKFLKTHTVARNTDDKNPYSTRRNSTSMAFSWRERFNYKQIVEVQSHCENVLFQLNHSLITSPDQLPYPIGRTTSNGTEFKQLRLWRYNNNPLAKKYLSGNGDFIQGSSAEKILLLTNESKIHNLNNTNIEIHKSYKIVGNSSLKTIPNISKNNSLKNTIV